MLQGLLVFNLKHEELQLDAIFSPFINESKSLNPFLD